MPIIVPSATNEATFSDMVNEVRAHLQGYSQDQELSSHVSQPITASGLEVIVANGAKASPGLVEIEDELLWVDSVDQNSSKLTVAPYGRGYQGTTAAGHSANVRVTMNPRFPQWRIKRELNNTIQSVSKDIKSLVSTSFTTTSGVYAYELPTGTEAVVEGSGELAGVSQLWLPLSRYEVDLQADTTDFPSGAAIQLFDPIPVGTSIKVLVAKNPELLVNDSDVFTESTGYSAELFDLMVLGAVYRLVGFMDPARLDFQSAEASTFGDSQPVGAATSVARYFYSLYRQRLDEEIARYRQQFRPRLRRTR